MKIYEIQPAHMNQLRTTFLRCDKDRSGQVRKDIFLQKLAKYNINLPSQFLSSLLEDIAIDPKDFSPDAILVYKYLLDVGQIFEHTPSTLQGQGNESLAFALRVE